VGGGQWAVGGAIEPPLKFEISDLKFEISDLKFEISDLKSEI